MKLGNVVTARCPLFDDARCVAMPGDVGVVEWIAPDGVPLVRFERSGIALDLDRTEYSTT